MKWQLCPKCNGQGLVSKPPWVPGDVFQWSSTTTCHICNMCNGSGKILEAFIKEDTPDKQRGEAVRVWSDEKLARIGDTTFIRKALEEA